jgi:hypothetical protein
MSRDWLSGRIESEAFAGPHPEYVQSAAEYGKAA